jgi:hypothetical protein
MATTKAKTRTTGEKAAIKILRPLTAFNQLTWRHTFAKNSPKKNIGLGVALVIAGIFVWAIALLLLSVVFVLTCVFGWVMDLAVFFKEEDDSDLRKRLAGFRWLSVVTTSLGALVLAVLFPVTAPAGALISMVAVTARLSAASGFAKPYADHFTRSFVAVRDGEPRGSWQFLVAGVAFLVPGTALGMQALALPEVIDGQFAFPADIAWWVVFCAAATSVVVAVVAGVIVGSRLKTEFGASKQYREALREALMVVFNQLSKGAQAQFLEAEQQGTLKMEQKGAEWEITLPTHLLPALRNRAELDMQFRQELNEAPLRFMVTQVWPKHLAIGPVNANEERIRRNLLASGGTEEAGGLAKGLTMDDPGFDDVNGMEEPLPRGYTVEDLDDWDKTAAIAAQFAELGLQLVGFNRASNKCIVEAEATATPRARWKQLTTPAGSSERAIRQDAEMLARSDRAVVLDLDLVERRVFLSPMLPAVAEERATIATELKADPMKVRIAVTWSTEGRAESVEVETRAVSPDPDAARETWRKVINAIHGGSNGWLIHPDPVRGITQLVYGEPRSLLDTVPGEALLPERAAEAWECDWHSWPIGLDAAGRPLTIDLLGGPHIAAAGGSGAGKSTLARLLMTQAILHGFEVVATDPAKRLGGLLQMVDFTKGMYISSVQQTAEMLKLVFAEVTRRVELTEQYGGEDWMDLPEGTVRPWLVFIDEWANNIDRDGKLGATAKGTPEQTEWEEKERAIDAVISLTGKIAAQARSAGIHLVMMSQTASTNIMPTGIRNNLGTTVQLKGKKPIRQVDADMLFPGQGAEALVELKELADGFKGLGVALDADDVMTGFRVGLLKPDEVEGILEARGARKPEPLMPGSAINPRLRGQSRETESAHAPRQSPQPVASSSDDDDFWSRP